MCRHECCCSSISKDNQNQEIQEDLGSVESDSTPNYESDIEGQVSSYEEKTNEDMPAGDNKSSNEVNIEDESRNIGK